MEVATFNSSELSAFFCLSFIVDAFFDLFLADNKHSILVKVASIREVVLGAPLRVILKHLGSKVVASDVNRLVALVHRPKESFFIVPQVKGSFFSYFHCSGQYLLVSCKAWSLNVRCKSKCGL